MKLIQIFTVLVFMFTLSFGSLGQVSSSNFLVNQVFSTENSEKILIDLSEEQCQIIETNSRRIIVEQRVSANIENYERIRFLTKKEKYHLKIQIDLYSRTSTLTPRKDKEIVLVNGVELLEESTYTIYIPSSIKVSFITPSNNESKKNPIAVLD
jgi:hypothetical protein